MSATHAALRHVLNNAELIVYRAIRQAFMEALPDYWRRRAAELDEVGTPWADGAAAACRAKAYVLDNYGPSDDDLAALDLAWNEAA